MKKNSLKLQGELFADVSFSTTFVESILILFEDIFKLLRIFFFLWVVWNALKDYVDRL